MYYFLDTYKQLYRITKQQFWIPKQGKFSSFSSELGLKTVKTL